MQRNGPTAREISAKSLSGGISQINLRITVIDAFLDSFKRRSGREVHVNQVCNVTHAVSTKSSCARDHIVESCNS